MNSSTLYTNIRINHISLSLDRTRFTVGYNNGFALHSISNNFNRIFKHRKRGPIIRVEQYLSTAIFGVVGDYGEIEKNWSRNWLHIVKYTKAEISSLAQLEFAQPILNIAFVLDRLIVCNFKQVFLFRLSTLQHIGTFETADNEKGFLFALPQFNSVLFPAAPIPNNFYPETVKRKENTNPLLSNYQLGMEKSSSSFHIKSKLSYSELIANDRNPLIKTCSSTPIPHSASFTISSSPFTNQIQHSPSSDPLERYTVRHVRSYSDEIEAKLSATISLGVVCIHNTEDGSKLTQFQAQQNKLAKCAISHDGRFLAFADETGFFVRVFARHGSNWVFQRDYPRGQTTAEIAHIDFSPNGKTMVVSSMNGSGHIFQLEQKASTFSFMDNYFRTKIALPPQIPSITFFINETTIAVLSYDGIFRTVVI